MQDLLGLGDTRKLKSIAGLAGGIGHQGANCGILTGGALTLGLASTRTEEEQEKIAARGCSMVKEFVRRFSRISGGSLCREIIGTDFDDDRQLRKYILTKSLGCVSLAARASSILLDILNDPETGADAHCPGLNRRFSERDFHCAYSVLRSAGEQSGVNPVFAPHVLIPLNGGVGYSGLTCAALLGGCIVIGDAGDGDTRRGSLLLTLRRMTLTLVQGSAAFNRLDLSPANDALLRCAELAKWFKREFGSLICRELTRTDFENDTQARKYFEENTVSKCIAMSEQTAAKALELSR